MLTAIRSMLSCAEQPLVMLTDVCGGHYTIPKELPHFFLSIQKEAWACVSSCAKITTAGCSTCRCSMDSCSEPEVDQLTGQDGPLAASHSKVEQTGANLCVLRGLLGLPVPPTGGCSLDPLLYVGWQAQVCP